MPRVKEILSPISPLDEIEDRRSHPGLTILRERLEALRTRQKAEAQVREATLEKMNHSQRSSLDSLAADLLADPATASPDVRHAREQLAHSDRLIQAIRLAIQKIEQEIMQTECEFDAITCRAVAAQHRRNVRHTINSMLVLQRSVAVQQDLFRQLSQRGVERTSHLVPFFPIQFAEKLADSNSYLSTFLREAVQLGFLTEAERVGLLQGRITVLDVDI